MPLETPILVIPGFVSTGSLTQYKLVKLASTAGVVKHGSSSADQIIGVLVDSPSANQPAAIGAIGIFKCLCEASVTQGASVTCSTTGRVKVDTSATARLVGIALDAYSTAGGLVRVLMSLPSGQSI
jgi:hypothetical protein